MIDDKAYKYICDLVYEYSRINLGDNKKELVAARLGKRLRAYNFQTYEEYCHFLGTAEGKDELVHLVDAISTNHTQFFREIKHFEFLRTIALPTWCGRLEKDKHQLNVWSAASSSGEEPYSLAIELSEFFSLKSGWSWQIEATDISTKILDRARSGVYPTDRITAIPQDALRRYFQKGTKQWEGYFRVKQELRDRVHFTNLNLLQPSYPFTTPFHIIFCRNVMIYFDKPTQEELIAKLFQLILPGGYLMIGHSESLTGIRHDFKTLKPAVYQRP